MNTQKKSTKPLGQEPEDNVFYDLIIKNRDLKKRKSIGRFQIGSKFMQNFQRWGIQLPKLKVQRTIQVPSKLEIHLPTPRDIFGNDINRFQVIFSRFEKREGVAINQGQLKINHQEIWRWIQEKS
jgi:hypothetical protein